VETADELRAEWFDGVDTTGVLAGASTRETDIRAVIEFLSAINSSNPGTAESSELPAPVPIPA
jgi:4-hydroxy-3-methylbut-2-enyl diphosphate reductase